jgi:hypothetical protein
MRLSFADAANEEIACGREYTPAWFWWIAALNDWADVRPVAARVMLRHLL